MKRAGDLYSKIIELSNILDAARKTIKGKGKKYSALMLNYNLEEIVFQIEDELKKKSYIPGRYHQFVIRDPKLRNISVPPVRDRVVHHALCNIISPIFNKSFIYHSYACRKGKGSHAAVKYALKYAHRSAYYLKTDIKSYFVSIDRNKLFELVCRKIKDPYVLGLIRIIIDNADVPSASHGKGIPIGNLTSQLFANLYLDSLDHFVKEKLKVKYYLRYMDDILLFGKTKDYLFDVLYEINSYVTEELLLHLKEKATIIAPVSQGVPFLGFKIFPGVIRLSPRSKRRFMVKSRKRQEQFINGVISEEQYVRSLNSIVSFVKTGNTYSLRRNFFRKYI